MAEIIADLHLHGCYSQACSKDLSIANLEKYARIKGINLLGTADFTHPKWVQELKGNLTEDDSGILKTKTGFNFLLSTEISLIYTQDNRGRRIHNIVLAPDFDAVQQITEYLLKHGRVDYDGRPIFKIPCPDFVESLRSISKDIEVIPAHIWTPWFSMFGSKSGFDSVEECFKDQAKHIHALETGLSSDPMMNWRLSMLDKYNLVSFSDSHSFWPWRLGREATIFDTKLSYDSIIKALRTGEGLAGTEEVSPDFGKYHFTGHRNCNVCMDPKEASKLKNICPKCGRELTIGVLARVEELADRDPGFKLKDAKPFRTIIPLSELIAKVLNTTTASKKVWAEYNSILKLGSEHDILIDVPKEKLEAATSQKIADIIMKNRNAQLDISPGYDGVYGEVLLEKKEQKKQLTAKHRQLGLDAFG